MEISFEMAYATWCVTQICCSQSHCPWDRPLLTSASTEDTQKQVWLSLCGVSRSWCPQDFVWALWESLVGMGFDSKCNFAHPTVLLGVLLCFGCVFCLFWWNPTISCRWQIDRETMETETDFFLRLQHHCRWLLPPWNLLLGRKFMTNLDSIFKSRDITSDDKILSSQSYGFSSTHVYVSVGS